MNAKNISMSFFFTIIIFTLQISFAQQSKEFTASALKAMGAPNNPKVEIAWNRYYDTKQLYEIMKRIEKAYPNLVKVSSIGKSVEGKDMWQMTISNFKNGNPDDTYLQS